MSAREAAHTDVQSLEEAQNVSCTRNILALNFVCLCDQVAKLGVPPKGDFHRENPGFPYGNPFGRVLLRENGLLGGQNPPKRVIFSKNSPF